MLTAAFTEIFVYSPHMMSRAISNSVIAGGFFYMQPSSEAEAAGEATSIELQPPATDAEVRRVALQGSRLAALWSDGTLQSYDLDAAEQQQHKDGGGVVPTVSLPLRGFALSCPQVGAHAVNLVQRPCAAAPAQRTLAALTSKLLYFNVCGVGLPRL